MIALSGYKGDCMEDIISKSQRLEAILKEEKTLKAQLRKLESISSGLEAEILQELQSKGLNSLGGTDYIFIVDKTMEPEIADWGALSEYIRKYDALDLLQKRLTVSAVRLRWADSIDIPGVDKYQKLKLKAKEL
jgi:hypothetical protein